MNLGQPRTNPAGGENDNLNSRCLHCLRSETACVSLCRDKVLSWHGKCDLSQVVCATILSKSAQSRKGPGYENRRYKFMSYIHLKCRVVPYNDCVCVCGGGGGGGGVIRFLHLVYIGHERITKIGLADI